MVFIPMLLSDQYMVMPTVRASALPVRSLEPTWFCHGELCVEQAPRNMPYFLVCTLLTVLAFFVTLSSLEFPFFVCFNYISFCRSSVDVKTKCYDLICE